MIFVSKNAKGEPAWKMVLDKRKTVTRRKNPVPVGAVRSVQPGRCKKGVGFIRILSCESHIDWMLKSKNSERTPQWWNEEARREGFDSWDELVAWLHKFKVDLNATFRIEFEVVE